MPETLLRTKLFVPPVRPNLVPRPRLLEKLDAGLAGHFTLVSAPAGFGKTNLLSEWLTNPHPTSDIPHRYAWLSLDENDNDPALFLTYLVTALQTIDEDIGKGVRRLLHSPQPPPVEKILAALINDITAVSGDIVLVLDDYHVIDDKEVAEILAFLLEHLPSNMHLAIATRADPALPLARLRDQGQLTELRAADLRFTTAETAEFLNRVMGLNLSAVDIAALETRTEGWIAALQLAAISLQGQKDKTGLIKSFSGSPRLILDYLIEEVLEQESQRVKTFLLRTAVLNKLTGPLCDALTGQEDGQQTLEYLEHVNPFIVPLDNERRWYRYHPLFAALLRQRLSQSIGPATGNEGMRVIEFHKRAAIWYEAHGLDNEAYHHAVAAGDVAHAARLAEKDGTPTPPNH